MVTKKTIFILLLSVFIFLVWAGNGILGAEKISPQAVRILSKSTQTEEILLKSRKFTPAQGISSILVGKIKSKAPKKSYVILQLEHIPTKEEKKELEREGVKLLSYIPNKAWFASIPSEKPEEIAALPNVRAIDEILPEDKMSPYIKAGEFFEKRVKDGKIDLIVEFFKDVSLKEGEEVVESLGGVVVGRVPMLNALVINLPKEESISLANKEVVIWVEQELPLEELNDGARAAIGVDTVQASPYNLDGTGIDVLVYDSGLIDDTHDDFGTRVTLGETGSVSDHSTHVAGTVGGDGTLSGGTYRGMAPAVDMISYYVSGPCLTNPLCLYDDSAQMADMNANFDEGITTYGADIGTASVGAQPASWGISCDYEGDYSPFAQLIDTIIYNRSIPITWAAANERGYGSCGTTYNTISPTATAKNAIIVGATNSNDDSMTSFSSWGPVDDGRVKPDVVAPGCQVGGDGGIKSTFPGDTYGVYCGTSMATPVVAGSVALMIQDYRNTHSNNEPLPPTIKAILIHTAKDLGNAGPDYSFGYGRIDTLAAIDKIEDDTPINDVIGEESVSQGEYDEFDMTVPESQSSLKVTLVWDDYPAAANADPTLVNDLNLVLIDPSETLHYPWVLNPNSPANPATKGTNTLDNVEQVYVATPQAGIWKIKVTGTAVPQGPQNYSLVTDFLFSIKPKVEVKTFKDSSYSQEDKFFDLGETIYIQADITADGNPITGATVTANLTLSNETIEDSLILNEIGNGIYRNSWDSSSHSIDVYLIKVSVSGPVTGEGEEGFHLYSGSGVSAYQFDWNSDGVKDFVLENKHLIAVFDGATNTDKSLLFLYQKDTDVAYNFLGISDTDTIGRGEVSTADLDNLKFHTFSLSQLGENLSSTTFEVRTELAEPGGTGQSAMFDDDDTGGKDPLGAGMKAGFTTASFGTLEFWTRCRAQTTGDSFDIMLENSGGTVGPDIYLLGGNIGYYDGAQRTIMAYTPDQWYHFKIVFDATTDTMDIYIDDMENPKTTGAGFWGSVTDINQIEFDTGQWLSGTPARDRFDPLCYLDDINIYSGATPLLTEDFEDDTAGADPNSPWTVIEDSADTNVEISNTVYHQGSIQSTLDLSIQMKSQDVDYLVYKLSNFDEYIDDISDIFSPVSGALGSSVNDDRYHFGDGTDGSITSSTPDTWTNFSTTTNQQRYVAVYDNSTASDPVSDNVISWIYFPNASSTAFQNVGLWYETGKEGLRIRYDTTSATGTNQAEYILSFTKGDYNTIDQWMSAIASGNYPETNFMSSHNVAVTDMVAPGSVAQGDTTKIDVYVANEGTFTETFDVVLEDITSSTEIGRETVTSLGPSQSTTIIFDWVTDGSTGLGNHTLEAFAGPVAGEVDTADNSMTIEVEVVAIAVFEMSFQDGVYPTSTYSGTRDTELKIFSPDEWEGDDLDFAIDGIDVNEERNALVKWDISAIPSGSTITSASITLTTDTNASDETFPIYECLKDWVEATATATIYDTDKYWGTLGAKNITDDPDRGTTVLGYVYGSVKDTTYTFNLNSDGVSLVQSWVDFPSANYGITIQKATATNAIHYRSRDSDTANLRPKLTVSYTGGKVLKLFDFPANLWQMISVPLQPENPDPEAILSDDLGNIFYNWTLARWQPFEGVYKYHKATCCPWAASSTSILPDFSPGLGYWLNTRLGPTDIDVSGDLTLDNDYYIHLSPGTSTETGGWNQIGVPFNYSVDWSSSTIKVKNSQTQEIVDIDTAQANNWVENKIWWQDGTSTQYSFAIAPEGQLDTWAGYWVHNFIECDLIVSPTPMQGAGAQAASIDTLQEIQPKFPENIEKQERKDQQNWQDYLPEWKIQLSVFADSKKDTYNFAGISPVAKEDYDALDVLEPPPISKGINLYFPHQDFVFNPGNYTQDIRKSDFKNKEWNFEIKSDLQQTAITLKWLGLEQIEYYDLSLIDLDANQTIDIYNATNYTFELEKGGIRHFELTAKVKPGKGKLRKK